MRSMSMSLRDWLTDIGEGPDWLASKLGVSGHTVRRWITGRYRPANPEHYRIIEELSVGRVTASDIILRPSPRRPYRRRPK